MKKEQVIKILKVAVITTFIMFACEVIFSLPAVNTFFTNLILNSNGVVAYAVIFAIMFLQVVALNIPAYVVLMASAKTGMDILSFPYISVVLSAYMLGCVVAYFIGRKFGIKAIKWCAGSDEDFTKWSNVLNSKGKWWYFASVILPIFPDDLLCIVAGSVKFNFKFYFFANLIGRGVGLIAMLLTLKLITIGTNSFPWMIIIWAVALIAEIITLKVLELKKKSD